MFNYDVNMVKLKWLGWINMALQSEFERVQYR